MPPRTRASTRTSGVATRGSTRTQTSQKAEATPSGAIDQNARVATKAAPKPKPKPKPKSKAKAKPKSKPKPKAEKQEDPEPSRKRARLLSDKSGPKTGKASKTVLLISLPVEVLVEIARYVHPLDLIMLSRVNKFFRDLFMDKRSALVWRSAQENVEGLPPCPDEVSQPQYAAMIFTKRCSSCGGYAPREMNPILLIRACAGCWTKILVDIERVTDPSLVSVISAPPPGQSHGSKLWCLYDEAREVKIKLNELNKTGDENKLQKWKEERHKLVEAKRMSAEPLSEWLTIRERGRLQDREDLKIAHRKEIESRLTKLGWEESDFSFRDYGRLREWQSMVETTRALTDKAWGDLLPRLIAHLEVNRKKRLETGQAERKSARNRVISDWFKMIHDQLPPYARAKPRDINHPGAGISTAASIDKPVILGQALPDSRLACEWPELSVLVDNDVPHKQFLLEFERNKARFQMLIMGWREELEAHLIELLPDDAHPPNFDIPPFALTTGTGKKGKPLDTLPRDIQRLLRADAIFTHTGVFRQGAYHYPHTFGTCGWNTSSFIYFSKAHEIVKALLSVLGLPDASHLGMEAYGKAFQCGRCPEVAAVGHRWRDIVSHYLESIDSWEAVTKQLERQRKPIKNFVYACAHDITVEDPERPLVRMCTEEPTIVNNWKFSKCLLCQKAGLDATVNSQSIMDHLRYVHLVDEPQKGTHYKNK